jgi:hypothetical protein
MTNTGTPSMLPLHFKENRGRIWEYWKDLGIWRKDYLWGERPLFPLLTLSSLMLILTNTDK